ncbi:MAG: DNA replication and repair protein RecF [Bdellovibrio sp.]|nr:DNA replication and repair protein RecF [Bdellovibrio sp.]
MLLSLRKIAIENFRNIKPLPIEFSPFINVVFGKNGNGKTNILEAIYLLFKKKSFRKNTGLSQILSYDNEDTFIHLNAAISTTEGMQHLSLRISKDKTEYFINGKKARSNRYGTTLFIGPFDSGPFFLNASERRDLIDELICEISEDYKKILRKYFAALKFRNILLQKKPTKYREQIKAINLQMAEYSCFLFTNRNQYVQNLNKYLTETYKQLFSEEINLKIQYCPTLPLNKSSEEISKIFEMSLEKDEKTCHTTVGPHRDDYLVLFNNYNALEFCSLGQQKMAYLSILFGHLDFVLEKYNLKPIILIDDISGELDSVRWSNLINFLSKRRQQIFITTANEAFKDALNTIQDAKSIFVSSGEIYTT